MSFGDVNGAEHLFGLMRRKDASSYSAMLNGNQLSQT